jgi:hypothetical protein
MKDDVPCLISEPHGRHPWAPLIEDPENPRVLHVGLAMVQCPGFPREKPDAEA